MDTKTVQIRTLNDELRHNLSRHSELAFMTPGIAALGPEATERIVKTVTIFDDFSHANDPHQEHDFGSFDIAGQKLFFKIDYYDPSMEFGSDDPTDPSKTTRVLTLMLAEEY